MSYSARIHRMTMSWYSGSAVARTVRSTKREICTMVDWLRSKLLNWNLVRFDFVYTSTLSINSRSWITGFWKGDDFSIVQQEIYMLKDCKHPNIIAYFGSYLRFGNFYEGLSALLWEVKWLCILRRDKLWIAMEFCGGGSLQDIYNGNLNQLIRLKTIFFNLFHNFK